MYFLATKTWHEIETKEELPPLTEHSVVIYNDAAYFYGGYRGNTYSNRLYRFDFATNECKRLMYDLESIARPPVRYK